ncbi:DUF1206 domain-containing protein [Aeromicrobium sp. A1-2]|uniref:DUF1206 domain-containing protein n=1 Tax=Aeromicrobium sp. A1-2 TaxID=2107713 RepID=UPI000E4F4222|nr:DUF1206 domain-containing protein [Aeromicrobium sp. A1-2]AXT86529.1 DUF1206 domain-containing protein [Aeromicrobium sp. A1-2]
MGDVEQQGRQARHSTTMRAAARVGLVSYGVVHLLIGWIALQIAWSGGGDASSGGALREIAQKPFGEVLLWIAAAGLAALTVWQLLTALWGHESEDDNRRRTLKRLAAVGRAGVYAALAGSAVRIASGSGGSGGGDSTEEGLTARLLAVPAGRVLVALVGLIIIALAVNHVRRGVTDGFAHDLEARATAGSSGAGVLAAGRIGYVGKGIAIAPVGMLFGWAAISYDPDKAGGLDDALKTVREQPYGPVLLTLVALGLAVFGLFCLAWARYVKAR